MSNWQVPLLIAVILLLIFFNEPTLALIGGIILIGYFVFSSKALKEDFAREYDEMEKTTPKSPTYKNVKEYLEDFNEMFFKHKNNKGTSLEKLEKGTAKAGKRASELLEK